MKMKRIAAAAALLAAALILGACTGNMGGGQTTPRPTRDAAGTVPSDTRAPQSEQPTSGEEPTGNAGQSERPTAGAQPGGADDPAGTGGIPAESPGGSEAPINGFQSEIEGFAEGRVIDPGDVPLIGEALEAVFPAHTVQQATHELYHGLQTYRLVLTGEGDLSKTVYMLSDGSILIPCCTDPNNRT